MTILQGHYPERLGRACIADCKFVFATSIVQMKKTVAS